MKVGDIVEKDGKKYRVLEYKEYPRVDNDGNPVTPVVEEVLEEVSDSQEWKRG